MKDENFPKFEIWHGKMPQEEAERRVKIACEYRNYEFLGFCNKEGNDCEYKGASNTYLKLHCNTCGNNWSSTKCGDLIIQRGGCRKCADNANRISQEDFLRRANIIHKGFYDYSKTDLEHRREDGRICIIHPIYGEFWQLPKTHLQGYGYNKKNISHDEIELDLFLKKENIKYETHQRFKWLGKMSLDFYLPQYNTAIECQGIQHFQPRDFSGHNQEQAEENFKKQQERDARKKKLCEEHGIRILYYSNLGIEYPYQVFEDKEELLFECMK